MDSSSSLPHRSRLWLALLGLALAAQPAFALEAGPPVLESVGYLGEPANTLAQTPKLSPNGRYVAFVSRASNLVPGYASGYPHVFLRDRQTGINYRASVGEMGQQYLYPVDSPVPSDDGRVVFNSNAPLVPELSWSFPNSGRVLTYLRDTNVATTELISRRLDGAPAGEAYIRGGVNYQTSEVALQTYGDLIAGGSLFPSFQIYVRNWVTGDVELITAKPDGQPTAGAAVVGTISATGRYVVFDSSASDLTTDNPLGQEQLFLRDRLTQTTRRLTFPFGGGEFNEPFTLIRGIIFAADERSILFTTNNRQLVANGDVLPLLSVFRIDLESGGVTVESVGSGGTIPNDQCSNGAASADGRFIAFTCRATNLTTPAYPNGVYVRDRLTDEIINVSAPLGELQTFSTPNLSLSADGKTLVFDWRHANTIPVIGGMTLVYSVAIRGNAPYVPPHPVPTRSLLALLVLTLLLIAMATAHIRKSKKIA